ncbi:disease resistance protein RGA5-like [Phragmites australis]|uniref:disease resistance protein RGA5-like n=1 Tax=Phragmites australis TaxID=29695 RepID=UPI002D783D50|nr:disease resistance protein RGA5-like [Phragmites australis]
MEAPTTCALGGAMFKLPGRLDGILRRGYMLPKGAEEEIPLIKRDLEEIIAILSNLEDDHAMMVRCWMKEVRELSYDMEDFVDHYEHATAGSRSGSIRRYKITRRRRSKTTLPWLHDKLRQRLWMANKIKEFSLRVQEVLQRHSMYNFGGIAGTASSTRCSDASSGSWHPAPCGGDEVHVGINDTMNKLEEWLMTVHDGDEKKLNVVSIVGFGGVGKTTLANELYRKLGRQFECRAYVRTSQKPDMRRLFISMLSQVRPHQPPDNWKVHSLISSIRTHLQHKRYLIIVDDLWATSTWDIIKRALPEGNSRSRILTTTEIEDLALQSSGYDSNYVLKMKPLGPDDSRKLFFSSIFGPQRECPPELMDVSYDIIRKCGGLPLAIVTIASHLASQLGIKERWDHVNNSFSYSLMTYPTLDEMKQVLNLCFNNLPRHLKACMLYMSIYQEDYIIWKKDLVNQWIAEGFICANDGQDQVEISRAYFDELVGRKMIQPVHLNDNGEVLSCVVHYTVLNFIITHRSIEENFVTAIHHSQATTTLADKVRRLSLHFGNAEDATPPTNMRLSQIRTLAFFGVFKCMPSIVEFRLLQVLILHFWGDKDSISLDLTRISELFRLRYLKVASNVTLELQTQMRGLQYLETLKIDARVSAIPSDIVHLPGLLHLGLPAETNLPDGIGLMTSLHTLGHFDLGSNSTDNVQSLSMLTNLRDLRLTCCSTIQEHDNLKSKMQFLLGSILGKLSNLKSLTLKPTAPSNTNSLDDAGATSMSISSDGFTSSSPPSTLLQRLELSPRICTFSCLPKFIRQLGNLCILKIGVKKITRDDVDVLKELPALSVLSLHVHTKPAERIVIGKVGFSVLTYLKFKCCDPWLKFEADAMPNLRKLELGFNARRADQQSRIPVGIEHLSGLREISAKIGGAGPEESDRMAAELAFKDAIRVYGSCPRVSAHCVDQIFGCKEDQNTVTQEEEYGTLKQNEMLDEEDSDGHDEIMEEDSGQEANRHASNRFTLSDQEEILDQDKTEQVEIIQNVPGENANYKRKPTTESTKRTLTSPLDDDGYSWRKYGQKDILGAKYPRGYYRCMHRPSHGCRATKTVQRMDDDPPRCIVVYHGQHTCPHTAHSNDQSSEAAARSEAEKPLSMLPGIKGCASPTVSTVTSDMDITRSRLRSKVKVTRSSDDVDDGYSWYKYGQKDILGAKYPRSYYRCTNRHTHGCPATKQVQRTDSDPLLFDIVYHGKHTCVKTEHSHLREDRALHPPG